MKETGKGSRTAILAICLFGLIWGAKAGVVDRYGSDIPNWDQWDAVGDQLVLPYLRGELTPTDIIRPHNEHRVALTRTLALGLLVLNGQWDARLECAVNAALHALFAVAWFLFGCRLLPPWWHPAWLIVVAALVAPPHSWQNATSGFASQQYLLLGLSTLAIGFLVTKEPWTSGWWIGVGCAVLAIFTMASGLLAAAAVLVSYGLLAARHRHVVQKHWITLATCAAVVLTGAWLHEPFPGHDPLKASSAREFFLTFWRSLQWPVTMLPLFPLFAWLPFLGLAAQQFKRDRSPDRGELVVLVVGVWVLLQFAAAAYARGSDAPFPSSRYLDTSLVGIGVVALSGLLLINKYPVAERFRVARACAFGIWVGFMSLGLWIHLQALFSDTLPAIAAGLRQREIATRAYIWTNDASHLTGREIPYPSARDLVDRLKTEEIRSVLPASIRQPEELTGDASPPKAFASGAVPAKLTDFPAELVWGSFGDSGPAATGTWTSQPLRSDRSRWLRFEIVGASRTGRVSLAAADVNEKSSRRFFASALTPNRWNAIYVPASEAPLTIVANDQDPDGWIGFSPPTEMATLSYWTAVICHRGFLVAAASTVIILAILLLGSLARRRAEQSLSSSPG